MALSSRQLDALHRNTVKFMIGAGIVGICLTAYTIISFSRFQSVNVGSKRVEQGEGQKSE